MQLKRICVFCGSRLGVPSVYQEAAEATGRLLAQRKIELIYGGGQLGLMGALASAAWDAGGVVTGVIPEALRDRERARTDITRMHIVDTMHQRKAMMVDLADAFMALPGGFGTYDEFCEVLTWAQLGIHHKPIGVLNVGGFYNHLLAMFQHASDQGFVQQADRELFVVESTPQSLISRLEAFAGPSPAREWTPPAREINE